VSASWEKLTTAIAGRASVPGSRRSATPHSAPSVAHSRMLPSCPAQDAANASAGERARELNWAT